MDIYSTYFKIFQLSSSSIIFHPLVELSWGSGIPLGQVHHGERCQGRRGDHQRKVTRPASQGHEVQAKLWNAHGTADSAQWMVKRLCSGYHSWKSIRSIHWMQIYGLYSQLHVIYIYWILKSCSVAWICWVDVDCFFDVPNVGIHYLGSFFFGGGRERISFSKSKIVSDPNWPAVWGGLKQPVIIVIGNWIPNRWELISGLSMRFWFQQLPACPFTAFRCPLWETLFCMFRGKIGNPVLRPS